MIPEQRDPDLVQTVRRLQAQVDDLSAVVVGRYGRGPTGPLSARPPADPTLAGTTYYATNSDPLQCRLYFCDGTGWILNYEPPQPFTPAWGNLTEGDATNAGYYQRSNGWADLTAAIVLGAASAVTGLLTLDMPSPLLMYNSRQFSSHVRFLDNGVNFVNGHARQSAASQVLLVVNNSSVAYSEDALTSATVPFPWTVGDGIDVTLRFRLNTLYS